jgi:hypothetical protein
MMNRPANPHQDNPSENPDRIGAVTASTLYDAIKKTGKGYSGSRATAIKRKASEQMTGEGVHFFQNYSMKVGVERKPIAKQAYIESTGQEIIDVPFELHDSIPYFGASPDGVFEGKPQILVEIKCPEQENFFDFLHTLEIPDRYKVQMTAQIACMKHLGAKECEFIMYHPKFTPSFKAVRFKPTKKQITDLEIEVEKLVQEIINAVITARGNQ